MLNSRRIAYVLGCVGLLTLITGCPVPQKPGLGVQQLVTEPRTGGQYYLYLPEAYVKGNGRHPQSSDRLWPLVMTFHGMKPYDTWTSQAREWQSEADNYGYIVCAPWLQTCDSFMEYPLRKEHSYVLADRDRVLAIMDHVFQTTRANPKAVLSTSWSCGGYLAHYFPNRYPQRFTCIATRLSNFSPDLLLDSTVPYYKSVPVAVFIGDGDFPACKSESEQAVAWYQAHGFRATGKMIDSMGHRRIPQVAAAFFAEQLGIQPLHPERAAATLAQVRMTDYKPSPQMLAANSPRKGDGGSALPPPTAPPVSVARVEPQRNTTPPSGAGAARAAQPVTTSWPPAPAKPAQPTQRVATGQPAPRKSEPIPPPRQTPPKPTPQQPSQARPSTPTNSATPVARGTPIQSNPATGRSPSPTLLASATPSRSQPEPFRPREAGPQFYPTEKLSRPQPSPLPAASNEASGRNRNEPAPTVVAPPKPVRTRAKVAPIKLSGPAVGTAPYYVSFTVDLPSDALRGADFLWMDNGMWICDEPRGVKILDAPGWHRISVLVLTRGGEEYRGETRVQILPKSG